MRELVEQLVRDADLVVARDAHARAVEVPDLGLALPPGVDPIHLGEVAGLAEWAPDDRHVASTAWTTAMDRPGELVTATIGMLVPGGFRPSEVRMLNLLGEPSVGVVLIAVVPTGPVEPAPPEPAAVRHYAPTWLLGHLDPRGVLTGVEGMAVEMLGRPTHELVGRRIIDFIHPHDLAAAGAVWGQVVDDPGATRAVVHRVVHPDGSWRWVESTLVHRSTAPGEVLVVSHDVTERVRQEEELKVAAATDPLTGLPNRREVVAELERRLAEIDRELAVLFVDLDGFKGVNDHLGHRVGDWALQAVGERLRDAVRPGDLVGRWGGDEFVVVCSGLDDERLAALTERIRGALAPVIDLEGSVWRPRASIGAALSRAGDDVESLLHRADGAMYEVKRAGRTRRAGDLTRWSRHEH